MACVTFQRQTQKGKMGSGDEEQQPIQGLISEEGFCLVRGLEDPGEGKKKHLGHVCSFCQSTGVVLIWVVKWDCPTLTYFCQIHSDEIIFTFSVEIRLLVLVMHNTHLPHNVVFVNYR